jgi:hypothetical protein
MGYAYSRGSSGGQCDDIVRIAMKKGECKRGNQRAEVHTGYVPSNRLFGQAPECLGCANQLACIASGEEPNDIGETPCRKLKKLVCFYYSATVLSVDLLQKRISCHDKASYSKSTVANVQKFKEAAQRYVSGVPDWVWSEFRSWTDTRRFSKDPVGEEHFKRFNPPWLKIGWFYWELFDERLAKLFEESLSFLRRDLNYRYYRFAATDPMTLLGNPDSPWACSFINEDAKRRWKARQKKRSRNGNVRGSLLGESDGVDGRRRVA